MPTPAREMRLVHVRACTCPGEQEWKAFEIAFLFLRRSLLGRVLEYHKG